MSFETLNTAGLLAIGLTPEWVDQDATAASYTGAPASATSGVYLQASPRCMVYVALRENVAYRTSRVTITWDVATTYTVHIAGVATAGATGASLAATLTQLIADLTALAGSPVVAVEDPDDANYVLITGSAEADYAIDVSVVGGAGTITATTDASSCGVRFLGTPGGIIKTGSTGNASGWVTVPNGSWTLDYRGLMERADCGGFDRGYLELHTIDGDAADGATVTYTVQRVMIGPAVLEATS